MMPARATLYLEPDGPLDVYLNGEKIGTYTTDKLEGFICPGGILKANAVLDSEGSLDINVDALHIFSEMIAICMVGRAGPITFRLENVLLCSIVFDVDPPRASIAGILNSLYDENLEAEIFK